MDNKNIDWEDVENKISIICRKFNNISQHSEDLAQELRIHAYYHSDNYYDLYRKAIDFWRKIKTKQSPEIPYLDLDITAPFTVEDEALDQCKLIEDLIRKELMRLDGGKWERDVTRIAGILLDIILEDIDSKKRSDYPLDKTDMNHYFNHRLNVSWVQEETGLSYKKLIAAMKLLEDTVRGLASMERITIPKEYM